MTVEEIREKMNEFWERVASEGREFKDSYLPLKRIDDLYRSLDDRERELADEVLSGWLLSDREDKRFAAMSVIADFHIRRAVPALRELVDRLEHASDPGAPFERKKAGDLVRELVSREGERET